VVDDEAPFVGEHVREGYKHSDMNEKLESAGFTDIRITSTYGFWGGIAWKLLIKYPITIVGRIRFLLLLLPFYYLFVFPVSLILNSLELMSPNEQGGCLMLVASIPIKGGGQK